METKYGIETEVRRLWHRVTGTIVLVSSSAVAVFALG